MSTMQFVQEIFGKTAGEILLYAMFYSLVAAFLFFFIRNALVELAEINAHSMLDPLETGKVKESIIRRQARMNYRAYVVTLQKLPLFPFVFIYIAVAALFVKAPKGYLLRMKNAVWKFWAY